MNTFSVLRLTQARDGAGNFVEEIVQWGAYGALEGTGPQEEAMAKLRRANQEEPGGLGPPAT